MTLANDDKLIVGRGNTSYKIEYKDVKADIIKDVPPGGGGGGPYVELNGDATAQEITGTGGLKTQGPLETDNGVRVRGGRILITSDNVDYGIRTSASGTRTSYTGFSAKSESGASYTGEYVSFGTAPSLSNGTLVSADKVIGFKGDLNTGAGTTAAKGIYNFYAEGNAPNYFKGLVESEGGVKISGGSIGGVSTGFYKASDDTLIAAHGGSRIAQFGSSANVG